VSSGRKTSRNPSKTYSGISLNPFARTAVSQWRDKSARLRIIDDNEIRLCGIRFFSASQVHVFACQ
jgi:hypothetical protein